MIVQRQRPIEHTSCKGRKRNKRGLKVASTLSPPGCSGPGFFAIFPPAVAKVYIVSFRTHNDDRPSKFIVLADSMKTVIKMAWEYGGADFQSRFDKSSGQAQEMKEGALRVL
jgi:hypothetical protein